MIEDDLRSIQGALGDDKLSPIGVAVARLDQVILSLLAERERLSALLIPSAMPRDEDLGQKALFSVPLEQPPSQPVNAYQPLLPGFWIGFEAETGTNVRVWQDLKSDPVLSPPDHHFVLFIETVDPGSSRWVTFEVRVGRLAAAENLRVHLALKLRANRAERMNFELSIQRATGGDIRVPFGSVSATTDFQFTTLVADVYGDTLTEVKPDAPVTLIGFLPAQSGFRVELAFLNAFVSRRVL